MRALRELRYRTHPSVTGVGRRRRDVRTLQQYAFADSVAGDDNLLGLHSRRDFSRDCESADDDVAARGVESGHRLTLRERHAVEPLDNVLEISARDDRSMNGLGVSHPDSCQINRCQTRERPARAEDPWRVPVTRGEMPAQLSANMLPERLHVFLLRVPAQVALRHMDRADGK